MDGQPTDNPQEQPREILRYEVAPPPLPAPGWYPDRNAGLMRWWDGAAWTEHVGPANYVPTTAAVPRKQLSTAYLLLIFLGALGIHHFYLERTGTAIVLLSATVVGWATAAFGFGIFFFLGVLAWLIVDLFLLPAFVREQNEVDQSVEDREE
jgi:TM2 domain-containing membrane protein YozV